MRRRMYRGLGIGRFFSGWESGSEGYDWKSRALAEKRSLALDYLGDVNKRVLIHDALRLKADLNREANEIPAVPILFCGNDDDKKDPEKRSFHALVSCTVDEEFDMECLGYLPPEDFAWFKEEMLESDETKGTTFLRNWIDFRKEYADYQNYAAIPDGERNAWSAWYLRNVRSNDG